MIAIALSAVLVATLCGCSLVVDGVDVTDYTAAQYTTYEYFNTNYTVSCYLPAERAEELKELWEGEIKESLKKVEGLTDFRFLSEFGLLFLIEFSEDFFRNRPPI